MSTTGIHSRSRSSRRNAPQYRRAAIAAAALLLAGTAAPALAQVNRQQQEIRDNSRQMQQRLDQQQRDQQQQFQFNQLRDQQLRQQQFQPLPPPVIGTPPGR